VNNKKSNKRIYLSPPHIGKEELMYVNEAFATNWIAPLGPNVNAFEQEFSSLVGVSEAVALSSGTAAIHLALKLLNIGNGDIVFCSSLTFVASANPILYQGATPVFIDSEPETWNMSPEALARALQSAQKSNNLPKAIIVVNLYGQSANFDEILALSTKYNIPIIEDAAESLGATYKGKSSGTIGDFGIYSFNGNKIITTSGGGMLVAKDEDALKKARFLSTQAREEAIHYEHKEMGYNYRLSNVLAGIGRGQLKVLKDRVNKRRKVFQTYENELGKFEGITFLKEASFGESNRWLTTLTIDRRNGTKIRDEIIQKLEEENIEARPVWKPLHLQPLFIGSSYFPHEINNSISEKLFATGICLPSGSNLTEAEQRRVISIVKKIVEG
jgi:pyridoxal phosphate-dependent aminotransferase EpsN